MPIITINIVNLIYWSILNFILISLIVKRGGGDIERIRGINLKIAERFFSNEEYMLINSKTGYNQFLCFYEYWTLKEAFVKAIGKGLVVSLDSFI
ncbi:hypothetical protein DN406_04030 [Bacillus sp. BB56-3]|nr:hypothetical protein DN406_04030 [Bacillus sp. BB56-3]